MTKNRIGFVLLAGGAEFGGQMADPDQQAMALAGGYAAPIRIIPAAAAPDDNHRQAGARGVTWFKRLGAGDVIALPVIDPSSAHDPKLVAAVEKARMLYLLGGFPYHLEQTLARSPVWLAMLRLLRAGGVIAGSSAGAMVLCAYYYDPYHDQVRKGLGLLTHTCILPHHENIGRMWLKKLQQALPDVRLVGIDEETGIINDAQSGGWRIYGKGNVTVYQSNRMERYRQGEILPEDTLCYNQALMRLSDRKGEIR